MIKIYLTYGKVERPSFFCSYVKNETNVSELTQTCIDRIRIRKTNL